MQRLVAVDRFPDLFLLLELLVGKYLMLLLKSFIAGPSVRFLCLVLHNSVCDRVKMTIFVDLVRLLILFTIKNLDYWPILRFFSISFGHTSLEGGSRKH